MYESYGRVLLRSCERKAKILVLDEIELVNEFVELCEKRELEVNLAFVQCKNNFGMCYLHTRKKRSLTIVFSHFPQRICEHDKSMITLYFRRKLFLSYYEKTFAESTNISQIENSKSHYTSSITGCIVRISASSRISY